MRNLAAFGNPLHSDADSPPTLALSGILFGRKEIHLWMEGALPWRQHPGGIDTLLLRALLTPLVVAAHDLIT